MRNRPPLSNNSVFCRFNFTSNGFREKQVQAQQPAKNRDTQKDSNPRSLYPRPLYYEAIILDVFREAVSPINKYIFTNFTYPDNQVVYRNGSLRVWRVSLGNRLYAQSAPQRSILPGDTGTVDRLSV